MPGECIRLSVTAASQLKTKRRKSLDFRFHHILDKFKVELPKKFDVEVEFKHHSKARRASFYPGVKKISDTKVLFSSDAYYEVLRFFMFCL